MGSFLNKIKRLFLTKRKPPIKKDKLQYPTVSKIVKDMEDRKEVLRFNLSDMTYKEGDKWIPLTPEIFWGKLRHTNEILVPTKYMDWIIGQDPAVEQLRLNLVEWPRKLNDLTKIIRSGQKVSRIIKERPGPYLLLVGDPGTGKSLIIKVAEEILHALYKKHGIETYSVLALKNPYDDYEPITRYTKAGDEHKILDAAKSVIVPAQLKDAILMKFLGLVMIMGSLMVMTGMLILFYYYSLGDASYAWFAATPYIMQTWFLVGVIMVVFPLFVTIMFRFVGGQGLFGKGDNTPHIIVDSSDNRLVVDVTVVNRSRLFGDVEWDPLGRSKPAHQRIQAGDVHKANRKLLIIDEIRNLIYSPVITAELLTTMEDGATHIVGHEGAGSIGGSTASQNVKSKTKVECMFFLIAAGNMDVLQMLDVNEQGRALRDRFEGYGDIIYLRDEMNDTPINRMKVAQVVCDETYRFNLNPVTRDGVERIINLMRENASSNDKLKIRFRQVIGVVRKAGQIAWDENRDYITPDIIERAIIITRSVEEQKLIEEVDARGWVKLFYTSGRKKGVVNGLYVYGSKDHIVGDVGSVSVWMRKLTDEEKQGRSVDENFSVTGAQKSAETWIQDSIKTVRTSIMRLRGIDIAKDYYTQIAFTQQLKVDGPSAGAAMILAILSYLDNKPLRQDIAVTGTVELLGEDDDIAVGPIGGTNEKALGAKRRGIQAVIVPDGNYNHSISERVKNEIKVYPAKTINDYYRILTSEDFHGIA